MSLIKFIAIILGATFIGLASYFILRRKWWNGAMWMVYCWIHTLLSDYDSIH